MDWHTVVVGAVGFLSGMAVTIMWAAAVVHAGRHAEGQVDEWDERRAARAENRRREEEKERKGRLIGCRGWESNQNGTYHNRIE